MKDSKSIILVYFILLLSICMLGGYYPGINTGTQYQIAFYPNTGQIISGSSSLSTDSTGDLNVSSGTISTGTNPNVTLGTGGVLAMTGGTTPIAASGVAEIFPNSGATAIYANMNGGSNINLITGYNSQANIATQTAPSSTSAYLMQGLAAASSNSEIIPQKSGNVLIIISGYITTTTTGAADGVAYQISYGTGTAPTVNSALAGTQIGQIQEYENASTVTAADVFRPFSIQAIVTGLTIGTTYWVDLAAEAKGAASDTSLANPTVSIMEQ